MWNSSDPGCLARHTENAKLLKVLPTELIEQESRQSPYRWAAYKFMGPLECTRQFAADYQARFRLTFYGACDFEPAIGTPDFETLWKMRLAADECSYISYRMYLAISFHLVRNQDPERYRRPHMHFKRRQETVSWNARMKKEVSESWDWDFSKVAGMGHFQRSSYLGLPAQDNFRSGIKRSAKANGWGRVAEKYVLQSPVLSPAELVSDLVGAERAQAIAEMKAIQHPIVRVAEKARPEELIQTCFAWPRSRFQIESCVACPQSEACEMSLDKL